MAKRSLRVSAVVPASPAAVYAAWLDAKQHGAMSMGKATSQPRKGGAFTAGDGYIRGKHLTLQPSKRIVQTWRTTEFPADAPDSRLEVLLERTARGTRVTVVHTELPEHQVASYAKGWKQFYFTPMKAYFRAAAAAHG